MSVNGVNKVVYTHGESKSVGDVGDYDPPLQKVGVVSPSPRGISAASCAVSGGLASRRQPSQ